MQDPEKDSMTDRTGQAPVTECERASNAAVAAGIGEPVGSALARLAKVDRRRRRKAEMRRQRDAQRQVHTFVAGVAWAWGAAATDGALLLPTGLPQPDHARALLGRICPALAGRIVVPQEGAESSSLVGCDPLTIGTAPTLATIPEMADAARDIGRLCLPPPPPRDVRVRKPKLDNAPMVAYILPEGAAPKEARRVEHRWLERIRRRYGRDLAALRESDDFGGGGGDPRRAGIVDAARPRPRGDVHPAPPGGGPLGRRHLPGGRRGGPRRRGPGDDQRHRRDPLPAGRAAGAALRWPCRVDHARPAGRHDRAGQPEEGRVVARAHGWGPPSGAPGQLA